MRQNAGHALRRCSLWRRPPSLERHAVSLRALSIPCQAERLRSGLDHAVNTSHKRTRYQSSRQYPTGAKAESTIYALSTARGRAAIAVIRISGPACLQIYHALCAKESAPVPRRATLRTLHHPSSVPSPASILDTALVLYFPAPATVTGEDVLELHVHGGPAIVAAVLAAIPICQTTNGGSIRYADPGEFTRRAFLNDRLNLTQIEALGDSLAANTEQQRRLSIRSQGSGLSKRYEEWRDQLLYARGELEALIDFSEDQHFDESPSALTASVTTQVRILRSKIQSQRENAVRGELLRNGIRIALLGAPNAGKSSLLNRVVGREAAIVSQEAGTTRDVVEVGLDLGGYLVRVGDMAGLRGFYPPSSHSNKVGHEISDVEQEGIARAKARALESDVVVVVLAISPSSDPDSSKPDLHLDPDVIATACKCQAAKSNILVAINKTDLLPPRTPLPPEWLDDVEAAIPTLERSQIFGVSCKPPDPLPADPEAAETMRETENGLQHFLTAGLIAKFAALTSPISASTSSATKSAEADADTDPGLYEDALGASARQRGLLDQCLQALDAYLALTDETAVTNEDQKHEHLASDSNLALPDHDADEIDIVLAAEHLRSAADCLAKITGRGVEAGDVEDVLGVVFEKFCVGK